MADWKLPVWVECTYERARPSQCPDCGPGGRGLYCGWYGTSETIICVYECLACGLGWACRFRQDNPQGADSYEYTWNNAVIARLLSHPPHLGSPQQGVLWPPAPIGPRPPHKG